MPGSCRSGSQVSGWTEGYSGRIRRTKATLVGGLAIFHPARRIGAFRARIAKPTIPSLDHGAVDEVLEQMPGLHAGGGTLCQLDGDQFFFGVYGEAGSEYAAPHCIAL